MPASVDTVWEGRVCLRALTGGLAERSKAAVLKTVVGSPHRGFESLTLRHETLAKSENAVA